MEKMRTKEEILKACDSGSFKKPSEATIRYCQLEVAIDIRDLLGKLVYPKYSVSSNGKIQEMHEWLGLKNKKRTER